VADDPDDPAIWLHPADPAQSVILGTNKAAAPSGAVVVFGLDGTIRQTLAGLDRPNNIDVEQRVRLGGRVFDLAIATERLRHQLRIFSISAAGLLSDEGGVAVLEGEQGAAAEPMGISLYKRPHDGALFAIVAPKTGAATDYLWQYRLGRSEEGPSGRFTATLVRRFGLFSGRGAAPDEPGEIEAVVVDDELGYVYYADERHGIHKWHADPDHPDAATELAVFGTSGYQRDREGLALYIQPGGAGFLVSTDQIPGGSVFKFYPRAGTAGAPHNHVVVHEVRTTVDETDGIEVTSSPLPGFPEGILVAMNSGPRNFALIEWSRLGVK
jgi:3-phytase